MDLWGCPHHGSPQDTTPNIPWKAPSPAPSTRTPGAQSLLMASVLAGFLWGAKKMSFLEITSKPTWLGLNRSYYSPQHLLNAQRGSAERGDAQMPADAEASLAAQLRSLGTEVVVMQDSFGDITLQLRQQLTVARFWTPKPSNKNLTSSVGLAGPVLQVLTASPGMSQPRQSALRRSGVAP